jgi:hypothetical protein
MISYRLQIETQKQPGQLSFLTYWHGHHALEFIYQTACRQFDLDLRPDIDLALRVLFVAEQYLPAVADDYLPPDATTPVVEDFSGVESSVRYKRGWVNPANFDAEALNELNDAIHLLSRELKPSVGTDLELCFMRLITAFQHLELAAEPV